MQVAALGHGLQPRAQLRRLRGRVVKQLRYLLLALLRRRLRRACERHAR